MGLAWCPWEPRWYWDGGSQDHSRGTEVPFKHPRASWGPAALPHMSWGEQDDCPGSPKAPEGLHHYVLVGPGHPVLPALDLTSLGHHSPPGVPAASTGTSLLAVLSLCPPHGHWPVPAQSRPPALVGWADRAGHEPSGQTGKKTASASVLPGSRGLFHECYWLERQRADTSLA